MMITSLRNRTNQLFVNIVPHNTSNQNFQIQRNQNFHGAPYGVQNNVAPPYGGYYNPSIIGSSNSFDGPSQIPYYENEESEEVSVEDEQEMNYTPGGLGRGGGGGGGEEEEEEEEFEHVEQHKLQ